VAGFSVHFDCSQIEAEANRMLMYEQRGARKKGTLDKKRNTDHWRNEARSDIGWTSEQN
jgi:hypothetical protein